MDISLLEFYLGNEIRKKFDMVSYVKLRYVALEDSYVLQVVFEYGAKINVSLPRRLVCIIGEENTIHLVTQTIENIKKGE